MPLLGIWRAELLGLNRKAVDVYCDLFRKLIYVEQKAALTKLKPARGTRKQPVFGVYQRNRRVIYGDRAELFRGATLQTIIEHIVSINAEINSDGRAGYDGLVDVGYDKHYRVNLGVNERSDGYGYHTNGIENFWSFTKRRMQRQKRYP